MAPNHVTAPMEFPDGAPVDEAARADVVRGDQKMCDEPASFERVGRCGEERV